MTDQPKWMPTDEEIHLHLIHKGGIRFISDYCRIVRDLLRATVEKALAEQEARHKREVIEARINEAREYLFLCDSDSGWQRLATIEAELAALEGGKP